MTNNGSKRGGGDISGISPKQFVPNLVTALVLTIGLSAVRFAYLEEWLLAIVAIVVAGILDVVDGRIARLLNAQSKFGAELDSLADSVAFGVAPTIIIFLWSLQSMPHFGWVLSMSIALACALRLARFNSKLDVENDPVRDAGFLTGVPAPAAAGTSMVPLYLWLVTEMPFFREPIFMAPWVIFIAFLTISSIPTYSWRSLRLRKNIRMEVIALLALVGGALYNNIIYMLLIISGVYLILIIFSFFSYRKIVKQNK